MIAWLTDTLIYTGLLIGLVLAARRPVARHFGAQMSYALWALPLLRFVMPPVVLPASLAPQTVQTTVTTATTVTEKAAALPTGIIPTPVYDPSFWDVWGGTLIGAAVAVWLAGALAFLAWRAWTYVQMREWLLDGARPVGEAGTVRLVESPAVSAPVAFGVSDKVVALPLGFMASENRAARDLAIDHELSHHRGRDLLANILAQPILALHWFNPLAWVGWRAMRRDQEAACDARVIAARDPGDRAAYGRVIASFASGQRLALAAPMACPVLGEKSIIHRLRSLGMDEISPRRRLAGRALLAGAALALPLTATISYAHGETRSRTVSSSQTDSTMTIVDVPNGADPHDPKLHTRVIEQDGQTIILKTAQPLTDEEAQARIAEARASHAEALAGRAEALAERAVPRAAMTDSDWVAYGAQAAKQGEQAARSADAWEKWGEDYGKAWSEWGDRLGRQLAPATPPTPRTPSSPAAPTAPRSPVAPSAALELPVASYGCDSNGNLVKIGRGDRGNSDQVKWCAKVTQANTATRLALIQARKRIARDRSLSEDMRDNVLDSIDNEIDHLDDIIDAQS